MDRPTCEVCGAASVCWIRDYRFTGVADADDCKYETVEPAGPARYLCERHKRKPKCVNPEDRERVLAGMDGDSDA